MKTQKSTTKCSFVKKLKIVGLRLPNQEWMKNLILSWAHLMILGSKRTNLKFGRFGEVRQSNIRIPSRIPFIWKCIFLNFNLFFSQSGGPQPLSPYPRAGPEIWRGEGWVGGVIIECAFFLQVDESMTGRASKRQFTVECLPSGISFYNRHIRFQFWLLLQQFITWDQA